MLIKSRKLVNFSAIEHKKKPRKRPREGKNAKQARFVEDFQATTGYLNFNPTEIKKKLGTSDNSTLSQIKC